MPCSDGPSTSAQVIPSATVVAADFTKKNFCYVCKKPQSKISRHLKTHEKTELDIAHAFSLRKGSKERHRLLEKLRNRGNIEHNREVKQLGGQLKVKRRPKNAQGKVHVPCAYCGAVFLLVELAEEKDKFSQNSKHFV